MESEGICEESFQHLSSWLPTSSSAIVDDMKTQNENVSTISRLLQEYEIEHTSRKIITYCNEVYPREDDVSMTFNIALQFPDSLLLNAPFISQALTDYITRINGSDESFYFVYVLGDTSYGECCVDEVAAKHLDTHLIVHYGNACLSGTASLPVLHVYPCHQISNSDGRNDNDVILGAFDSIDKNLLDISSDGDIRKIVILYDLSLSFYFRDNNSQMCSRNGAKVDFNKYKTNDLDVEVAQLKLDKPYDVQLPIKKDGDSSNANKDSNSSSNYDKHEISHLRYNKHNLPLSNVCFLWLTMTTFEASDMDNIDANWELNVIRNSALELTSGPTPCKSFSVLNLSNNEVKRIQSDRLLRRRFAMIQKVEAAQRIGILVGTLGISGNIEIIERLINTIESKQKFVYIILIGKLNDTKISNFIDIDLFVLVSCPQHSLLSNDFYKQIMQPILTPFELEAALLHENDMFQQPYSTNFLRLLSSSLSNSDMDSKGNSKTEDSTAVTTKDHNNWKLSNLDNRFSAAEFLNQRSWKGLSYNKGGGSNDTLIEDLSLEIEPGQHGIASQYDREVSANSPRTSAAARSSTNEDTNDSGNADNNEW